MDINYDVLSALKVALDNNLKQRVLMAYREDCAHRESVIEVTLEDGFKMECRYSWDDRHTWTCDQTLLVLFTHFKKMYEDVYKCDL